jgi:branched-chain amino acid aminotransferase
MNYINLNGKIQPGDKPALLASNRGYRYGDGLFETMKVINEKILLGEYHFERLFSGLSLLKFEIPKLFTPVKLTEEILRLCEKNECGQRARVRLSVFRGNGGLYDDDRSLQYIIECWPLDEAINKLNDPDSYRDGLLIDIYSDVRKSCDIFSNLKSSNFLPYTMAAIYAKENQLNDCLLLNESGNIADATTANLFIIKDGMITTPALSEGCVNGVMRRHLLERLKGEDRGFKTEESIITIDNLLHADEVFLTNAIKGIRWVKRFRGTTYGNTISSLLTGIVFQIKGSQNH